MLQRSYRCPCGNVRRESNHWFAAQIQHYGAVYLYTWARAKQMGILDDSNTIHLCGHACVSRIHDEWMTGLRNEVST